MIRNNRTAMNAYKKTREKHGGDRPRCVVCGEAMDPEDDETEWSRTKTLRETLGRRLSARLITKNIQK